MSKTKIPKDEDRKKSINNFLFVIFITGLVLFFFILPIIANIIFIDYRTQLVIMGFVLIITILSGGVIFINYFSNKSSTPKEQSRSVHNVDYLINNLPDGVGEIKIWNETGTRAVAVLTKNDSKKGLAAVFVPNKYAKKIKGDLEGKYELYFTTGRNWNYSTNEFEQDPAYFKMKALVDYSGRNDTHTILPVNPSNQKSVIVIEKERFPMMVQDVIERMPVPKVSPKPSPTLQKRTTGNNVTFGSQTYKKDNSGQILIPTVSNEPSHTIQDRTTGRKGIALSQPELQKASSLLKSIWSERDDSQYQETLQLLSEMSGGTAGPFLPFLKSDDKLVRYGAVMLLGELRDASSFDCLLETVLDDNEEEHVRGSAAISLGRLKDPRAIEPLLQLMVNNAANIPGNSWARTVEEHREWYVRKEIMLGAGGGLAEIGKPAVTFVSLYMNHEKWKVREQVAIVLGLIGGIEAVRYLHMLSKDSNPFVSSAANHALVNLFHSEIQ